MLGPGVVGSSHAGRPLATEDAPVQADAECAVDSYVGRLLSRDGRATRSLATQFGCGVGWRTQLALGYSHLHGNGEGTRSLLFAGKTSLTEPRDDGAGLSLAYGAPAETKAGSGTGMGDFSATLAGSLPVAPEWALHANLGWTRSHKSEPNTTRWAVAVDHAYGATLHLVAETFADDRDHRPWLQAGASCTLNQHLSLNASYGRQVRSGAQAITLGFIVAL